MTRRPFWLFLLLALVPSLMVQVAPGAADDQKRVALVIGNASYKQLGAELKNPINDAAAMAEGLRGLGMEVIEAIDLDYRGMREALRSFDRALQDADVGLFYYAGHGMEFDGRNYLFPTDAILETEGDVGLGLIGIDQVLRVMESTVATRLVFLDACRNNPLARSFRGSLSRSRSVTVGRGLGPIDAAVGTFIAFATAPGDVAADGKGANSPFTNAMLTHLPEPGLEMSQLMQRVRNSVIEQTDGDQVPWESSSLRGPLILNLDITINPPAPEGLTAADARQRAETLFWESVRDSDDLASFQAYVDRFGDEGLFAPLAHRRIEALGASEPEALEAALDIDQGRVQLALIAQGYDVGEADGLFGPQTRRAIKNWQAANRDEATGFLNAAQLEALLQSETAGTIEGDVDAAQRPATEKPEVLAQLAAPRQRPAAPAARRKPGEAFKDCPSCPDMVVIPSGSFEMGGKPWLQKVGPWERLEQPEASEQPVHQVNLGAFALGRYEVTRAQYAAFLAATGREETRGDCAYWAGGQWRVEPSLGWKQPGFEQDDSHPITCVSWEDSKAYVDWLSRTTGQPYRLPSEAEWEYACKGGEGAVFATGETLNADQARFNSEGTLPVGSFAANPFGLHDLHGNVWEWVEDRYQDHYEDAPADGRPWLAGDRPLRAHRGGDFDWNRSLNGSAHSEGPSWLRCASRASDFDYRRMNRAGLRVARSLTP